MIDRLVPETASAPPRVRARYVWRNTLYAGLMAVLMLGGNTSAAQVLLGEQFGEWVVLAVIPVLMIMAREFVILMRALDELQFRIHMTALAIAGGATALLATSLGMLYLVIGAPSGLALTLIFPAYVLAYYLALFFVSQRY